MYKEALNILNILDNNGFESYIVGGFVRDKILGIESDDIDIITSAKPDEISNVFNIELEDNYGSVKLLYNGFNYEITTFRKESNYYDNRRPSNITYITDVREDLNRRDFTINTILIDKNGNYIDYLGGINDLNNRLLKVVGDSDTKIKEDALRIMRSFRFASIYNLNMDIELEKSIFNNSSLLKKLSFDRIKKELNIIFNSLNANLFFNMISKFNLYKTLEIEPKNSIISTGNYLSIWAQLDFSDKYNFSNVEKKYINDLKDILNNNIDTYTVYKYDKNIVKEANKILKSNIDIDELYNKLIIRNRSEIDISYDDIYNIVKDKTIINKIYVDLEHQILYNKIQNQKDFIISYIEGEYSE